MGNDKKTTTTTVALRYNMVDRQIYTDRQMGGCDGQTDWTSGNGQMLHRLI